MKKLFRFLLVIALLLSFTACGEEKPPRLSEDEFSVYNGTELLWSTGKLPFGKRSKFSWIAAVNGLSTEVSTARGIKIGSTLEEVGEAYGEFRFNAEGNVGALESFIDELPEDELWLYSADSYFDRGELFQGKNAKAFDYEKAEKVSGTVCHSTLDFEIENGVVTEIYILFE